MTWLDDAAIARSRIAYHTTAQRIIDASGDKPIPDATALIVDAWRAAILAAIPEGWAVVPKALLIEAAGCLEVVRCEDSNECSWCKREIEADGEEDEPHAPGCISIRVIAAAEGETGHED